MKHKGFTLIEILVGLVIIGILATVSVVTYTFKRSSGVVHGGIYFTLYPARQKILILYKKYQLLSLQGKRKENIDAVVSQHMWTIGVIIETPILAYLQAPYIPNIHFCCF